MEHFSNKLWITTLMVIIQVECGDCVPAPVSDQANPPVVMFPGRD